MLRSMSVPSCPISTADNPVLSLARGGVGVSDRGSESRRFLLPPPGASGVRSLVGCSKFSIMVEGRGGARGFANTGNRPSWKISSGIES